MMGFLKLTSRLPLPLLHAFGIVVGLSVFLISSRFRRYHRANLGQAGILNFRLTLKAAAETGKGLLELPTVWLGSNERVAALVRGVEGWHWIEEALAKGLL